MTRRFPAPWSAVRTPGGYMIVDANNLPLAYIYANEKPTGIADQSFTPDEARRIAAGIARLPELIKGSKK